MSPQRRRADRTPKPTQLGRAGKRGRGMPISEAEVDQLALQRAVTDPSRASAGDVAALQATYGNRAVSNLLRSARVQAKLTHPANALFVQREYVYDDEEDEEEGGRYVEDTEEDEEEDARYVEDTEEDEGEYGEYQYVEVPKEEEKKATAAAASRSFWQSQEIKALESKWKQSPEKLLAWQKAKTKFLRERKGEIGKQKHGDLKSRLEAYANEEWTSKSMVEGVIQGLQKAVADGLIKDIPEGLQKHFGWGPEDVEKYFQNKENPYVKYLDSPAARAEYELVGGATLLQGKPPRPFDTSEMFSKHSGTGFGIYVMAPDGSLYAHAHKVGLFHHSSFLAGMPTAGAGEIKVDGGALKHITNKSGHYQPGKAQMYSTLKELQDRGTNLSGVGLTLIGQGQAYPGGAAKFLEDEQRRQAAEAEDIESRYI
jgi:hypothetical protein